MVTIGDSFSIVATLAGLALTLWSFLLVCGLLFPARVEEARSTVSLKLGSCFGSGILAFLFGLGGFLLLNIPNALVKLLGTLVLASYFGCVAVGTAGVAKLAGERIRALSNNEESMFHSFSKGAAYIIMAGILPVLGWFLFAPLMMVVAGGAGFRAVVKSSTVAEVA